MGKHDHDDDQLDEVLASLERARNEPEWVPPEPRRGSRRLIAPPEALERARWVPRQPAVLVLLGCAALAVLILGVRIFLSHHDNEAVGARSPSASATSRASVTGRGALSSGVSAVGTSATATVWSIHVVGAVKSPGVVAVSPGARVKDAVAAAGGLAANADSANINLARILTDGEQIHVPRPGESVVAPAGGAGSAQTTGAAGGVVNLNTADVSGLDSLPGVGPVLAQRILDWRTAHGKFSSIDELGEVSGIGDKALERLRPHVSV